MKLPVYTRAGAETGRTVELDEAVFGVEPNDHVIWLDVRSIQAAARQGTHKTKERAEVSYSTRKLFRQKGTGGARRGSRKSPLLRKGGTVFGPRPHEYNVRVNRKTKQLARRSALAYKLQDNAFRIIEDLTFDAPKTREMVTLLSSNGVSDRKVLILTAEHNETIYRSGRNLPKLEVLPAATASTLDLLGAHTILLMEGALEALTTALRPAEKASGIVAGTSQVSDDDDAVETAAPVAAAAPVAETPAVEEPVAEEPAEEPAADEASADETPVADEAAANEEVAPEDLASDEAASDDASDDETTAA